MTMLHVTMAAALLVGTALGAPLALAADARVFPTPDAAVGAVVEALEARDRDALLEVFGSDAEDVVFTGEEAQDREAWSEFLADYRALQRIAVQADGTARLYIGRDQWPFPAPLAPVDGGWRFDADAAREEVFHRRIGQNELDVIDLLRAYVRVQAAYRQTDHDGDGVMEFAAGFLSTPGTRDGLYWPPEPGTPDSPVGDFVARAAADGYALAGVDQAPEPFLGYYYRVLHGQGDAAPGGAYAYRINGNMVAGHAVIAFPAAYAQTGIMTFLVNENGVVLERDLGDDTLEIADAIERYDPSEGWVPAD